MWRILSLLLAVSATALDVAAQQEPGSIRGSVEDADFEAPLANATVTILQTEESVTTDETGSFLFPSVAPDTYTLVFSKQGYQRQLLTPVVVAPGALVEVSMALPGDFTDMEEFVVQDLLGVGTGAEGLLLELRLEAPALIDSVSSDLMSKAGASDAGDAVRLVAGATVKDGKSAVIRGLPDRYISSQLNGVRLPSADEDKRAVELDQFPAAVIDNVRVTKTFTPDQFGDASGGAVDIRLRGIPDETILQFKSEVGFNTKVTGRRDFLSYVGGGVDTLGRDDGGRDEQLSRIDENWEGAVGVTGTDAPLDYKWSAAFGGSTLLENGVKIGGFANFFYERDSSVREDAVDDSLWVDSPGQGLSPEYGQGSPGQDQFFTELYDIQQGSATVQWGTLGILGVESANHTFTASFLSSRTATDTATLAEDTRGKDYYFEDYDVDDPLHPGNDKDTGQDAAPWVRLETLNYTERTTSSLQLAGVHKLPFEGWEVGDLLEFRKPELGWTLSHSTADLTQPDKRQFGSYFHASTFIPGVPPFTEDEITESEWLPYKPSDNINLGNLQRIFKTIEETSDQRRVDLTFPFDRDRGRLSGFFRMGFFDDVVKRDFDQNTYANGGEPFNTFEGDFDDFWSEVWEDEDHPIRESEFDVDYKAELQVSAWYLMTDMPITERLNLVGGIRFESTDISLQNDAEELAFWFPRGGTGITTFESDPDAADVDFSQRDALPSIALIATPLDKFTVRASYSQTVARQTFKELTPILQQEFLGGPIFIGDPGLKMSELKNYDLRLDYTPFAGGLMSASYFKKDIKDPIEIVQRLEGFTFNTPVNYPEGELSGIELEFRQEMVAFSDRLEGLTVGFNSTFINSEVTLPDDEQALFEGPGVAAPRSSRDMTNAPSKLFNAFVTYDFAPTDTRLGLFWTVQGDTLVAGAGVSQQNLVPNVYATRFDTLNFSLAQGIGPWLTLSFKAKNLTNPSIEEVYRSDYLLRDVRKTSYTRGIDYSISLTAEILF